MSLNDYRRALMTAATNAIAGKATEAEELLLSDAYMDICDIEAELNAEHERLMNGWWNEQDQEMASER